MGTDAAAVREKRRKKRENAECGELGCLKLSGADYYCDEHAKLRAARSSAKWAKRKVEGDAA